MQITIDSVMALGPCADWPRERVAKWFGERKYANATTTLRDESIPRNDRLWLAVSLMDKKRQRLFGCDCAERALNRERDAGREPDQHSWDAIAVARRYATGEATREELSAARAAAGDAARDAAWDAAWAAAWAAAWDAARDAAWDAARDAAWDAARDAEMDWLIAHAIDVMASGDSYAGNDCARHQQMLGQSEVGEARGTDLG